MNKGLTVKTGQTHVPKYHHQLLKRIEAGEIDPSFVVPHQCSKRRRVPCLGCVNEMRERTQPKARVEDLGEQLHEEPEQLAGALSLP
jgi:threonine dehydrogenase-like Zn-dependent dehydrogenase